MISLTFATNAMVFYNMHFNCIDFGCELRAILNIDIGHNIVSAIVCINALLINLVDDSLVALK